LQVGFRLACAQPCDQAALPQLPATNRDPARMTTVVMTGVTALVRATAFVMNNKGITYPGRDIHDWLAGADITHISNEVPFASDCPDPDPAYSRLVFCSDPRYIDLLRSVGADVIELTGNHYADYGPEAMLLTLKMYNANRMAHYGGGSDLADARKPLLLEDHGNKIAFIGCNSPDVGRSPTATSTRPGAAPCDYDYMTSQIRQLRSRGYLVIATFQYYESYSPTPFDAQVTDFHKLADAGAVVVQGSQAHNPQSFAFDGSSLIHYGLGNLFFDQMGDAGNPTRHEFIDRHVFYDGKYISTELLTAMLEDYSRPRPMTPAEREDLLTKYFAASGW
jgi:poly-gamma-glutamate synthesis protein (capsule biosynthesis protein)